MQNTTVQGAINHLFEGHTFNYVECINVEYKSTRKESYMDLQLDVKGCKNVLESFAKYTEVEMLDGQNQYKAEGHGLQVSKILTTTCTHATMPSTSGTMRKCHMKALLGTVTFPYSVEKACHDSLEELTILCFANICHSSDKSNRQVGCQ